MKVRQIIYAAKFEGSPKESDFKIVDEDLGDQLKENEFFYEAIYISCDPYVRLLSDSYVVGKTTIPGYQLAKVLESKNPKYPSDSILVMNVGWRTGGKSDGSDVWYVRTDIPKNVPMSAGVGIFAMTGLTAYYGVNYVLKPKAGDTILVSGSAGAVGTVVGQLAKGMGCRVIGSCGSEEKIKFVKSVGFDDAFNYKTESVAEGLKRLAPKGVDLYFDNVGGSFSSAVLENMNKGGRVACCGAVSSYNSKVPAQAPVIQGTMALNSLSLQGFNIFDDIPAYADEIYVALKKWAAEGKLKQHEYLTNGFESLPSTFIGMLRGKNFGKTIVKM